MRFLNRIVAQWRAVRLRRPRLVLWVFYFRHFGLIFALMIYLGSHGKELGLR